LEGSTPKLVVPEGIETLSDGTGLTVNMSESAVDPEEVAHIADLARVDLDDDELAVFAEQFADILAYFETLDEVPEVEREPDLTNVMRTDEVEASLSQAEALANAPDSEDGFFKGPRVS
jgi:aspartyl-tRNA(Asn)/glutamyl-tRNA(Gln) amidotransferase subunit C